MTISENASWKNAETETGIQVKVARRQGSWILVDLPLLYVQHGPSGEGSLLPHQRRLLYSLNAIQKSGRPFMGHYLRVFCLPDAPGSRHCSSVNAFLHYWWQIPSLPLGPPLPVDLLRSGYAPEETSSGRSIVRLKIDISKRAERSGTRKCIRKEKKAAKGLRCVMVGNNLA